MNTELRDGIGGLLLVTGRAPITKEISDRANLLPAMLTINLGPTKAVI